MKQNLSPESMHHRVRAKMDGLTVRTPWNPVLQSILEEIFSATESEIYFKMPYGLSDIDRLSRLLKLESNGLKQHLDGMAAKGLVLDLWINNRYYYTPAPFVIGIFELTMMRANENSNVSELARLFQQYLQGDKSFWAANFDNDEQVSVLRVVPHETVIGSKSFVEILDFERASHYVEEANRMAIGDCSCRKEKLWSGDKQCETPIETCSSFGISADFMIRYGFGREVDKSEMLDNLARSRELGLVLSADNVQKKIFYMCHCCKCCCNPLLGISRFGYTNALVSSNFTATIDSDTCIGCGKCARACPIDSIDLKSAGIVEKPKQKIAVVHSDTCLGCGVCALKCPSGSLSLIKNGQRQITPQSTFERIILQSLERGNLPNQLFDDPQSLTHKTLRYILGGFLKLPPVKKSLMSDLLRSTFLSSIKAGARLQGRGWMMEI